MTISVRTRKQLWGRSGNRCSISTCRKLLELPATELDSVSTLAEECHIRPQSPRGPRGADVSEGDINGYDNLLLLCPNHHKEVDHHRNTYPIERLRTIKADHEAWVQLVLERAISPTGELFTLPGTHRKNPYFTPKHEITFALRSFRAGDALVLCGPPGVGKTQHAVQHAHDKRRQYSQVLWASADSVQGLHQALAALADRIPAINEMSNSTQAKVFALREWLAAEPSWLLILDNADSVEVAREIDRFIPSQHLGYVLVTSQIADWTSAFHMKCVDVWTVAESAEFLMQRLPRCAANTFALARLSSELGGLPLALEHAAAYMTETGISADDYLVFLSRDRTSVFGRKYPGMTDYQKSIAATWQISMRRLSWLARQILQYAACLAAEPVPRSILSHFEESASADGTYSPFERRQLQIAVKPPDAINLALAELGRFSLVSLSEDSFRLHPLLQRIVLDSGRVRPWQARYWRYWFFAGKHSHLSLSSGLWLYRVAFLLNLKGVLPKFYGDHAELLELQPFMGHLQALSRNIATIAPELHVLRDGAFIGGVAPLIHVIEWSEKRIKEHQSGMSALREMLDRNAHGSHDLTTETEWFLSQVDELFGQIVKTSRGQNLTSVLRWLAGEGPQNPRGDLYRFLELMASEHAAIGAVITARRLFHLYRAHAIKDPDAPANLPARARLMEALSLRAHMQMGDLQELLEEALVIYEQDESTNLDVYRGVWIYSITAETPETQSRALAWIEHALPNARKMLEHGCEHACALTEQYVRIVEERGETDEALSVCEETLRLAIKSRKLARGRTASLWERRGDLLSRRKRFLPAARSYARCLALEIAHDQPTPFRRIYLHYMTAMMHLQAGSVSAARMRFLKIHDLLKNHWSDDPVNAEAWAAAVGFSLGQVHEETESEVMLGRTLAGDAGDTQTPRPSDA